MTLEKVIKFALQTHKTLTNSIVAVHKLISEDKINA